MSVYRKNQKENIIKNMLDLWDNLKNSPYPIVLYGMGNGADKIIKVLEEKSIKYCGVFSSDGFQKKGKTFHGFPVLTLGDFEKIYQKLTVLMCFGSARSEVIENVKRIKEKHIFYAPDVPLYGNILFDNSFYNLHKKAHDEVYSLLADDISKKVFNNTIKYKLSGKVDYLFDCETSIDEAYLNILKLNSSEIYLDLGAYRGDTVFEFIDRTNNSYNEIIAVEPDIKTFNKLSAATSNINNLTLINACISNECKKGLFNMNGSRGSNLGVGGKEIDFLSTDSIIGEKEVTYIKVDIEGAEGDFIKGARNTIKNHKPKMMISCYHRSDDLINIPKAVLNIRSDYKIYMRHFPSLPAWDTVYYFI